MLSLAQLASVLSLATTAAAAPQPLQVGYSVPLSVRVDGSAAFNQTIARAGANYLSVHFTSLALPPAAKVTLTCDDGAGRLELSESRADFYTESLHCASATLSFSAPTYAKGPQNVIEIDQFVSGSANMPPGGMLETVCSIKHDSTAAACLKKDAESAKLKAGRAVARLLIIGRMSCTGWLFGSEGHMITNNHCIGSDQEAANTQVEFDARCSDCDSKQNSVLGACGGTIAATSVKLLATDELRDFSLVKLDVLRPGVDLKQFGYLKARESSPVLGEPIWTVHHEAGFPQRFSLTNDDKVATVADLDMPSCIPKFPDARDTMGHFLDTLRGSSGAPIMSTKDNVVVALHNCGLCDSVGNANRAIKLNRIVDFLKEKNLLPKDSTVTDTSAPTTVTSAPTTVAPVTPTPTVGPSGSSIRLCTFSQKSVFERYQSINADSIDEKSPNTQFEYNADSGALRVRSNGECLDAYAADGTFHLHTWSCDASNQNQQWTVDGDRVAHRVHNVCLTTTATTSLAVATCNSQDLRQRFSTRCDGPVRRLSKLRTPKGLYLSEWNGGVYANGQVFNVNELFEISGQQIKAVSNGECLDAFTAENGRLGLHTYKCDASNPNQQWAIGGGKVEHAGHRGQCLDVDPTDPHHNVQMWQCFASNDNQRFEVEDWI